MMLSFCSAYCIRIRQVTRRPRALSICLQSPSEYFDALETRILQISLRSSKKNLFGPEHSRPKISGLREVVRPCLKGTSIIGTCRRGFELTRSATPSSRCTTAARLEGVVDCRFVSSLLWNC